MKTTNILLTLIAATVFGSCTKKAEVCIDGPEEVIVGEEVTYKFCGEAKEISWSVSDGYTNSQYEGNEITVTFDNPTEYATVYVSAEGGLFGGSDDQSIDVKVGFGGFRVRLVDSRYSAGYTNIEGIANGTIDLYTSKTCWDNETQSDVCFVGSATADADGYATFTDLEAGTYVADARGYDIHANWNENVRSMEITLEEYDMYTDYPDQVILDYNAMYLMSSSEKWQLTDVKANESSIWSSVSNCAKDNYLEFSKDGSWLYAEGENSCEEPSDSKGTYNLYLYDYPLNEPLSISFEVDQGAFEISNMTLINEGTLETTYYYYDDVSGETTTFIYTFKKQ